MGEVSEMTKTVLPGGQEGRRDRGKRENIWLQQTQVLINTDNNIDNNSNNNNNQNL